MNKSLILISSSVSLINSNFEPHELKIINIIVNFIVALLLSMMNTFKIDIKAQIFHNLSMKMNRLCHMIEYELTDNIHHKTPDAIVNYINEYDNLNETLEFGLIDCINNKVKLI
jgi:abortive infection bacteriophage resistance protein